MSARAEHLEWIEGGTVIRGKTPKGRATVVVLNMNHPDIVTAVHSLGQTVIQVPTTYRPFQGHRQDEHAALHPLAETHMPLVHSQARSSASSPWTWLANPLQIVFDTIELLPVERSRSSYGSQYRNTALIMH